MTSLTEKRVIEYQVPGPEIVTDSQQALATAQGIEIDSPEMREYAIGELKAVKGFRARLEAMRTAITGPINQGLRAVNDLFRGPDACLESAEKAYKAKIVAYDSDQEAARKAEEARLAEEARKERERLEREAVKLEEKGKIEQAEAKREIAATIPASVVLPAATPKVAGVASREEWCFEIVDPALVPDQYKVIDEKKIRAVVKALKGAANIPGVKVYATRNLAVSA